MQDTRPVSCTAIRTSLWANRDLDDQYAQATSRLFQRQKYRTNRISTEPVCRIVWFSEAYGRGIDGIILTTLIAASGFVLNAVKAVYRRFSSGGGV